MEPVVVDSVSVRKEEVKEDVLPVVEEPEAEAPALEEPVVDVPLEEPAVVEIPEEEPESIKDAFIQSGEKAEVQDKVLTGKALVEQISEDEKQEKARNDEMAAVDTSAVKPVEDEAAEDIVPVIEEIDEPEMETSETPIPAPPAVEVESREVPEVAEVVEDDGILDKSLDGKVVSMVVEIISIMVIFALSSVIRNKYSKPLPLGLSFLLAILFTAIPILIAFILFGWSNLHLIYTVLIFTVFIFSSRRGH